MIYYNSNRVNKIYKGTSIINQVNDYVSGSTPTPRLPQGYTEVEWVGSTSSRTSSFDTLIALGDTIGNTFSIEGKMWTELQSGFGYLISNEWATSPYPNFCWRWNNSTLNLDTVAGIEQDVELSLTDMGDGLSGFTISSDGLTLRNPKTVFFFCGNRNTSDNTGFTVWRNGYGKLYGDTKITKNGVLVSNLIPCKRDSDSTYGFYCSVRETFLGGTNLVGGDEVIPSGTTSETKVVFQYITVGSEPTPPEPTDYSKEYLTFDVVSGGTIVFKTSNNSHPRTISYSLNNGSTWVDITSSTAGTSFNVSVGDKVMFKGNNSGYGNHSLMSTNEYVNSFSDSTAYFNIEGNIMSLLYGDGFYGQTSLPSAYCFYHFFDGCKVCDASNLVMPATSLTKNCYEKMFNACVNLTAAPTLPATTLVKRCYGYMFGNCSNLSSVTCLATNISASQCLIFWLNGVAASGTFTKAASMTSWPSGSNGIPNGWTVVDAT